MWISMTFASRKLDWRTCSSARVFHFFLFFPRPHISLNMIESTCHLHPDSVVAKIPMPSFYSTAFSRLVCIRVSLFCMCIFENVYMKLHCVMMCMCALYRPVRVHLYAYVCVCMWMIDLVCVRVWCTCDVFLFAGNSFTYRNPIITNRCSSFRAQITV